ncbi:MAG: methyltransferase domain-containing protein [Chloroflexi bacterium]|nr:methyltransferase domain-containing protein [Chloroflexota bacterium]
MKQWYEELFTDYANTYDKEEFTKGTVTEVDFIESEIEFDSTRKILDVGCGTGRHAIELAKRGYQVTGIDLSEDQLKRAKEKAESEGVEVTFLQGDARDFSFDEPFDVVIMMCEGAFPLMETDEMNFRILQNAERSLKESGKFIFTTLNALFPLYHSVKDFVNAGSTETQSEQNTFDLLTFRDHSTVTVVDDSGRKKTLNCSERYYAPSEITWLLKSLNFKVIDIYGCATGDFSRGRPLTTDDFEMLVIAQK